MNKLDFFWEILPKNIEYWILIFFVIRLIGIQNPPLENIHNFRQSTVWMVAYNYAEIDNNIMYPRVDYSGNNSGITPMEFPLLNYLIYLIAQVVGFQYWIGRAIVLICSSIGLYFFYRFNSKIIPDKWAKYSTFLLILSIFFTYSRKTMPDIFSISLISIGLYFLVNYFETFQRVKLVLFFVFSLLGMLSKASSFPFFFGFFAWIVVHFTYKSIYRQLFYAIFSFITILILVYMYYKIWCPYLLKLEPNNLFFLGNSVLSGINDFFLYIPQIFQKFYFEAMKWSGFGLFLAGLFLLGKNNFKNVKTLIYISFVCGIILVLISVKTFATHSYYVIPLVPIMCIIAGYIFLHLKNKKIIISLLVLYSMESILSHKTDFWVPKSNQYLSVLDKDIGNLTSKSAKFIVNSNSNPTPLLFIHRKGWTASNEWILNKNNLDSLKKIGLKNILILKKGMGNEIRINYPKIKENENFILYKI